MRVTQEMIANKAGVDRSTVSKILSNNPNYHPNEKTRERVFQIAEDLGYDFGAIHNPLRRKYSRFEANAKINFRLVFEDGEVFDEGHGVLRNISSGGALLTDIVTTRQVFPLKFFTIELKIEEIAELKDIVAECEVVRFGIEGDRILAQIGLKFSNLMPTSRQKINQFLEQRRSERGEEQQQQQQAQQSSSVQSPDVNG